MHWLLLAALGASPVGLTLSAEVGKPPAGQTSASLLEAMSSALTRAGVQGALPLKTTCLGDRACLVTAGKHAGASVVVSVSIAWGKRQTTVDLEGITLSDSSTFAQTTFSAPPKLGPDEAARFDAFARQVLAALPTDAPKVEPVPVAKLDPPPTKVTPEPIVVVPAEPPAGSSKVPAFVLGGGALATGIASGVLLGVASGTNASLQAQMDGTSLTRTQAEAQAATANGEYTASLALGITAGALAVVTIILLAKD